MVEISILLTQGDQSYALSLFGIWVAKLAIFSIWVVFFEFLPHLHVV